MQTKTAETKIEYPTHPINMIVPSAAGGGMDLQARMLEKLAFQYLSQPFVVLNKPGGGGNIGWNELAAAAPDGYTVGLTGPEMLLQPAFGSSKYHYLSALEPLAQISAAPLILVVSADQPWRTVGELVQYAKQHPGELKLGHSGLGSISHIAGAAFADLAGIQIEAVPFRGGSETTAALLGGHVQIVFSNPGTLKAQIQAGKVRALATTGEQRLADPELASIPTLKEQGVDLVLMNWFGVAAPKVLPQAVKAELIAALKKMVADPEFKLSTEKMGLQVDYLDGEASLDRWVADREKLTKLVEKTGVLEQIRAQRAGQ